MSLQSSSGAPRIEVAIARRLSAIDYRFFKRPGEDATSGRGIQWINCLTDLDEPITLPPPMLKILFHRNSWVVRGLEAVGIVNSIIFLWKADVFGWISGLYLFLLVLYAFIRICDAIPWYPGEPRGRGIEVHFRKAIVPTAYILAFTSLLFLLKIPLLSPMVLSLAVLFMLLVTSVNGILIWYHLRDRDPLKINYFSSNQYLLEKP